MILFLEFLGNLKKAQELHVLSKIFGVGPSWNQDALIGLRVGEVAKYLLRKNFIDFAVTRYGLRHAGFRVMVYIMFGAMAD